MDRGRNDVVYSANADTSPRHLERDPRRQMAEGLLVIALSTMLIDQVVKYLAMSILDDGPIDVFGPVSFHLTTNTGVAFSLGAGSKAVALAVILSCFLVAVVVRMPWATANSGSRLATGLLVGGVLGNLIDRVGRGSVVDFIHVRYFSVFNLADIAIVAAVVILLFALIGDMRTSESPKTSMAAKPRPQAHWLRRH